MEMTLSFWTALKISSLFFRQYKGSTIPTTNDVIACVTTGQPCHVSDQWQQHAQHSDAQHCDAQHCVQPSYDLRVGGIPVLVTIYGFIPEPFF